MLILTGNTILWLSITLEIMNFIEYIFDLNKTPIYYNCSYSDS